MSLAPFVHAMGRGPSRGRSLTQAEAEAAMTAMLLGDAAPEAVGALLMLMRYRGETAEEIAGFTRAARAGLSDWQHLDAALDWPSYAAGRSRGLPWFLLSALLVARAGHPILLHGWNSNQNPVSDVRLAATALGIPLAGGPDDATAALKRQNIAYAPLEVLSPPLLSLLRLRDVLGLRSAVNTVCRMLNPTAALSSVQGVFHPPYRTLQQDAGALLGQQNLTVLKGAGGEFERHPGKAVELFGLASGHAVRRTAPVRVDTQRRLADPDKDRSHLLDVWRGQVEDLWAAEIVVCTAGAALMCLRGGTELEPAEEDARALWATRHQTLAA